MNNDMAFEVYWPEAAIASKLGSYKEHTFPVVAGLARDEAISPDRELSLVQRLSPRPNNRLEQIAEH